MCHLMSLILLLACTGLVYAAPVPVQDVTLENRAIRGTKYIFSFGDSYSQTGFDPSATHPSSSNPIGNPNFPGYTTSGGMNWLGQLIHTYNTSLMLDWNFAYGGATVDASLIAPYTNTVKSLVDQVNEFNSYVSWKPSYAPWTSANSLFAIWIGVNDVGNSYGRSDESTLVPKVVSRYMDEAQMLYNSGARNFLFLTVPPINRSPLMLSQSSSAQSLEASVIANYNGLVYNRAAAFKSSHSGTTVWVVDTQQPFNTALNNPTAYGAPNAACYNSDGVSCLWWNNYHPGQAIQKLVAQAVVAALRGTFF